MAIQGKRKSSWIPALLYPGILCLGVSLGFLYYYEKTIARTQELLNDRAFRVLTSLSERLTTRIASFDTVLRQSSRLSAASVEKYFEGQVTDLSFLGRSDLTTKSNCGTLSLAVSPPPANAASQNAIFRIAHFGVPTVCATVTADRLVNRFLNEPASFFDEVLLAKADGTVLFQTAKTSSRIADLSAVFPGEKPAAADDATGLGESLIALFNRAKGTSEGTKPTSAPKSTSPSKFLSAVQSSGVTTVQLGGAEYRLYTVPVVVSVEDFGTHTIQQQIFGVCGLYRTERFQSVSKAVPPVQSLVAILLLLFVLSGAWPFFRFPFMGITERVPRRAGLYYFLSMLGAAALLTILALHFRYYTEETDNDRRLERLATTIEINISTEVRNALSVIHDLTTAARFTAKDTNLDKSTTCAADPESVNTKIPAERVGLLAQPQLPLAQYPYFDNIFWADVDGFQRAKWSVHSELTPPTRVCNFGFFQETLASHLWYFGEDGPGGPRFRVDPLFSPNTAEYMATISQDSPEESHPGAGIRTVHLVTQLLTLVAPVLPPDFGFAIIDESGHVLFHSDPAKNGSENLFAECLDSDALQRATASRLVNYLTVAYLGRQHRMLVSPFQKIQESHWTLIVFADTAAQRAQHWSRMFLCTAMALLYFILLTIAGLFIMRFGRYPPACLAPTDSRKDTYRQIAVVMLVVCWGFWHLIFVDQERFVLYAAVVTPFLSLLFIALKLRQREKLIAQLALILLLGCALGLLLLRTQPGTRDWRQTLVLTDVLVAAFSLLAIRPPRVPLLPGIRIFTKSRSWYAAAAAQTAVAISILPCVAFFRVASDFEQDLFTRREQILVTDQMRAQESRVTRIYDPAKVPFSPDSRDDGLSQLARWRFLRRRLTDTRYRYDSTFSGWEKGRVVAWNQTGIPDHLTPELILLANRIPPQAESASGADYLAQNIRARDAASSLAPALPEWMWYREGSNQLRLDRNHALDPKHAGHLSTAMSPYTDATAVDPPEVVDVQRLAEGGTTLLDENRVSDMGVLSQIGLRAIIPFLAVVITGVFLSVRSTIGHVFLTDLNTKDCWPPAAFGPTWDLPSKVLLLGPPWGEKASQLPKNGDVHPVDVADLLRSGRKLQEFKEQNVVLNHFAHGMDDARLNRTRLELLERLVFTWKKNVVIVSSIDPAFYIAHDDEEMAPLPEAQISDEGNRWAKVLYGFETLWVESNPTVNENYHRIVWSACTRLERAALYQLATDGLPNHKNRKALEHLYYRRLVTWKADDPVVRIAAEEFRKFIARSVTRQDRAAWDEPEREGQWIAVRNLVGMILIGVTAAALYVAQQQTLALFTSASTLVPSAWKFISEFRGGKAPSRGEVNA
jgi:hypothetical protein